METAGVLRDGEKIWGLAKVNDGVEIVDGDVIKPYLLLATSYDGSLATTARFTSIRVVCNNTLQMARADNKSGVVKVRHDSTFDSDAVRRQLGIFMIPGNASKPKCALWLARRYGSTKPKRSPRSC